MTIENIEVIGQIDEAFAHQDLEGLLTLVDPECVVTQDASLPWGGHHVGHDGVTGPCPCRHHGVYRVTGRHP